MVQATRAHHAERAEYLLVEADHVPADVDAEDVQLGLDAFGGGKLGELAGRDQPGETVPAVKSKRQLMHVVPGGVVLGRGVLGRVVLGRVALGRVALGRVTLSGLVLGGGSPGGAGSR